MRVGGTLKYQVHVSVAEFGALLLLGGEARFTNIGALELDPERVYKLPTVKPAADAVLSFEFEVHSLGGTRERERPIVAVSGLEVRVCA